MATGFTPQDHATIMGRNNGLCERCGTARSQQAHHRKARGMGGVHGTTASDVNRPSNGLGLCAPCHGWVEGNRPESVLHGWLVPRGVDPAGYPALLNTWMGPNLWVILNDDGTYTLDEEAEERWLF